MRAPNAPLIDQDPDALDLAGNAAPIALFLELAIGDRATGRIVHVCMRNGGLSAAPADLDALGISIPVGVPVGEDGRVSLDAIPGLAYRYEPPTQRLVLHVPSALRQDQRLGYRTPPPVQARRDPGLLLTYDAYGRHLAGRSSLGVASSLRWFGRAGAVELTGVSRAGNRSTVFRRLETRWTYSDPVHLWTWTAGDLITAGHAWTRPVRMAAVQWRRNFGVRPDLITLPMPRFVGEAEVPSSVDLYVNNIRQFSGEVLDGPFLLDALPRISGYAEASLIVTDALGRVTETTVPLYVDHQRLAPGLTDFSVEAGVLRAAFAGEDDRYLGGLAVHASGRRGMTRTLTVEGNVQASSDVRTAGAGLVWSPAGRWGLVSGSYVRSGGESRGDQFAVGYQVTVRGVGLDAQLLRRSPGFRELADASYAGARHLPVTRARDRATGWVPLGRGSLAATWLRWRVEGDRARVTRSLSWTQTLGRRLSASASVFDDDLAGRGGALTVTVPLGGRLHGATSLRRSAARTSSSVVLRQAAPFEGGWGWRVQGGDRDSGTGQAAAEVRGRSGEAVVGLDHNSGGTGGFAQAGGSVVVMEGKVFLSRRIHDGFAVVSTNGLGGIPVLTENRRFGRTGASGYLLVPDLRGWQRNRIAIDPDELTAQFRVGPVETLATPADRSGVVVRFDIAELHPALAILHGPDGNPVPAGTRGHIVETGQAVLAGFEGEVYLADAAAPSTIEMAIDGVPCRFRLPAAAERHPAGLRLGVFTCERISS